MKEYHVVFEGANGFQKEDTFVFDYPPPTLYRKEYAAFCLKPLDMTPIGDMIQAKDRCFRQRASFYALGKNILYYTEER